MADEYPLPAFHFSVSLDGNDMGFSEVVGLNMEVQEITYRDGLSKEYGVKKIQTSNKHMTYYICENNNKRYQKEKLARAEQTSKKRK